MPTHYIECHNLAEFTPDKEGTRTYIKFHQGIPIQACCVEVQEKDDAIESIDYMIAPNPRDNITIKTIVLPTGEIKVKVIIQGNDSFAEAVEIVKGQ